MVLPLENEEPRCPYCIRDAEFRLMTALSNGSHVCENCGHTVSLNDKTLRCSCMKCVDAERFLLNVAESRRDHKSQT